VAADGLSAPPPFGRIITTIFIAAATAIIEATLVVMSVATTVPSLSTPVAIAALI
jgi:hypothetical protein